MKKTIPTLFLILTIMTTQAQLKLQTAPPFGVAPFGVESADDRQVVVAGKVLPCGRRRVVRSRADVVDAVPLGYQPALHIA